MEEVVRWLGFNVPMLWSVYPSTRTIVVYRSDGDIQMLGPEDTLTGDPVLPGFSCPVKDLFD